MLNVNFLGRIFCPDTLSDPLNNFWIDALIGAEMHAPDALRSSQQTSDVTDRWLYQSSVLQIERLKIKVVLYKVFKEANRLLVSL